jgi:hypothetical protein
MIVRALVLNLAIGSLFAGQIFKCDDIGEVLEYERNVKDSGEAFNDYLEVTKEFGGQEVTTDVALSYQEEIRLCRNVMLAVGKAPGGARNVTGKAD